MSEITLNDQQALAKDLIVTWLKNVVRTKTATVDNTKKMIFVLAGYAGTGKTTLLNYLIHNVLNYSDDEVAFATPTGKAASVLIQKGVPNASTIHKLIYHTVVQNNQVVTNGHTQNKQSVKFFKKQSLDKNYKLIIIDEVSMVSKNIMNDLLSFGVPILATGDSAQLPPVLSESNHLLDNPNYILTDIVRQESDSQIIRFSKLAREGHELPYGNFNNEVIVLNKAEIDDATFAEILLSADQVICGLNKTKDDLNKKIRNYLGYTSAYPSDGEKIICTMNNYDIGFTNFNTYLVNGLIGTVKNFKVLDSNLGVGCLDICPSYLTDDWTCQIPCETTPFVLNTYKYDMHQDVYLLNTGNYVLKHQLYKRNLYQSKAVWKQAVIEQKMNERNSLTDFMLNRFEYGYAISCHKSQGSEWDNVVVIDEHQYFRGDAYNWLYTAVTRAKKKLIIIK